MQKEVHVLGPLLPIGFGTEPRARRRASVAIETFLGQMLLQHGNDQYSCKIFLSLFGFNNEIKIFSDFLWHCRLAPSPEYIDELIEALIEKKAPFVRTIFSIQ